MTPPDPFCGAALAAALLTAGAAGIAVVALLAVLVAR
jgi:hypothetical protein